MRFFGAGAPEDLDELADHFEPPPPGSPLGTKRVAAMAALYSAYTGSDADRASRWRSPRSRATSSRPATTG